MQLLSRYNKGIRFLLCVIDIFSKHAWVVPLKDKKGVSVVTTFQYETDGKAIYGKIECGRKKDSRFN